MGTPSYMSPEQFMGQTVDGRSDIFSCGVILYQFLTGEKPFTGNTTTIMYKVLREEPLAPSMLNVALPAAFDAVVRKAMAKNPDERYQTAQEFSDAIKVAVAGKIADATFVNTAAAAPSAPSAPAAVQQAPQSKPSPSSPTSDAPSPKSKGPALALAGVAAALVLGGAGYWALGKKADTSMAVVVPNAGVPATNAPAPGMAAATTKEPVLEPGTMVISALGLVDPNDPKFKGDPAAALAEARSDAKRQLVEKALALYVDKTRWIKTTPCWNRSCFHNRAPSSKPYCKKARR